MRHRPGASFYTLVRIPLVIFMRSVNAPRAESRQKEESLEDFFISSRVSRGFYSAGLLSPHSRRVYIAVCENISGIRSVDTIAPDSRERRDRRGHRRSPPCWRRFHLARQFDGETIARLFVKSKVTSEIRTDVNVSYVPLQLRMF